MILGEDNILLEAPILLLMRMFKIVKAHYPNGPRQLDAYEHFWTGAIVTLLCSWLGIFWVWLLLGIPVVALIHIVWKEVWNDRVKRISPEEWQSFYVDMILRSAGFIFTLPFVAITLYYHMTR